MLSRSIRGNPRLALAAVGLATFMTSLDNTVVNVALPSIQRDLRLSTPHAAFLAGYSAGLAAAAALVLAGGVIALRTMPGRVTAATGRPQPGPVQAGPRRIPAAAIPAAAIPAAAIPAAAIPAAAIPAAAASGVPRYPAAQSRPCAEPSRAAA